MANQVEATSYPAAAQRTLLNLAWGAVATALCVLWTALLAPPAAVLAALGKPHAVTPLSRLWGRLLIRTCSVKVRIEGLENLAGLKTYTLVSNHQSFFDIFSIVAFMPGEIRLVAKKELLKIPVLGYALKNSGHVIIDRQSGGKEIRKVIESSREGFSIAIFAEGHRFSDNRVHEFEDGAAWLAIMTRTPAVPMAISGSAAFFPRLAKIVVPGGTMRMTIGKPIPTEGLKSSDRTELTRKLEEAVRATFSTEV
ncbi:MAG TPA: lysophospholipid acyltransferase family protein [Candidatus Binataceae bacterium]